MKIEGVGFDQQKTTVVILKDWDSEKRLPIWIGAAEARSIALQLEGTTPPRPLAHDLLMNCIRATGGRVIRVVINDLQDRTFYATIDIDTARKSSTSMRGLQTPSLWLCAPIVPFCGRRRSRRPH
jgi:bifunctional DNase/RNase